MNSSSHEQKLSQGLSPSSDKAASISRSSPFQPLPVDEMESLLRLPRMESSDSGPIEEELGPGDVQYLRGHSQRQAAATEGSAETLLASQATSPAARADGPPVTPMIDTVVQSKSSAVVPVPAPSPQSLGGLNLEDLGDLNLDISIELGRTELLIEDVLKLREGSVVALDKLAGDPVDIVANGRLVARGELLVIDGKFGVRLSEVV